MSFCLATNSTPNQDQHHQQATRLNFRHHQFASLQPASQDPSKGSSTTPQDSDDFSQVSAELHNMRDFSRSGTKQPPQFMPQSADESKMYSATNKLNSPYFTTPSWRFTPPTAPMAKTGTSSKPVSSSRAAPRLGSSDSASAPMPPTRPSSSFPQSSITQLADDDDSADDEDLALWMAQDAEDEMRRLSVASSVLNAAASRRSTIALPWNLPITLPLVSLNNFTYKGIPLAEKVYVELEDKDFLRIVHIIQDTSTSAVTLRGWKFRRTRELNGVIDRKLNEVCWILHVDEDDPRDVKDQGMETVPVSNVIKRRRIRITNQSFPALSWREDEKKESPETVENDRVLVCRFKYLCFYPNAKARAAYAWHEKGFHRLREDACDQRCDNNIKDEDLRKVWRGETVPGGSQEGWLPGEKEFLRQEDVSHRGIPSWASLKAPSGPDFPMGDPMKRGSVGALVRQIEPQRCSDQATQSISLEGNDLVHRNSTSGSNDALEQLSMSSISRSREGRQDERNSQRGFPGFDDPFTDSIPGKCDKDDDAVSVLRRGLRQSSIQPREYHDRSPRIVKIDAHVQTSSSSGTFEKRYEGKVTSRYYPASSPTQTKRSAEISFGSPTRPSKKIDRGFRAESNKADLRSRNDGQDSRTLSKIIRYPYQESASSDSDRTLGRSQSPDSVEEMCTPSNSACYMAPISGLPTPVSRRKNVASRRSSKAILSSTTSGLTKNLQTSPLLPITARSSGVHKTQAYGTTEDDNDIVDLTRPQANPYGRHSVLSSGEASSRPTFAHSLFKSEPSVTSTGICQRFSPNPSSLPPMTPRSSQDNRMPSPLSLNATLGPSSRLTEKSCRQNQITAIKSSASKAYRRRYTFGDCFSGAGGMSRGAVGAGLRIKWAFDFNLAACQNYQLNFFGTPIYNVWANDFSEAKGNHKVDICHLSPPCQFFSDAHTIQGKDDDMNTASLFAIFNLLEKAKPRIVTLEQTSGLIRRHPIFFNAVINMFTSRGFSVRWKVMNCADFGLPQRRTRLFVMASW